MGKISHPVITIGHSNHESDAFVALLRKHGVNVVVDVRSAPYSRYLPHFNREYLEESLKKAGIRYVFRGKELGGQPANRTCYDADGRVVYGKLAATAAFKRGIEYVLDTAAVHPSTGSGRTDSSSVRCLALMCSEKEPLDCHRTLAIAQTLTEHGLSVAHIHADGILKSHEDVMNRLLDESELYYDGDLLRSRQEMIADAVKRQAKRVGARWQEPSED